MSDQGNPIWPEDLAVRGSLLPLGRTQQGELTLAWPGAVRDTVNSAYNALMAPGVALTGREARGAVPAGSYNPLTSGLNMALLMAGSGLGASSLLEREPGAFMGSFKGYHGTPYTFEPVEHNPFGEFRDSAIGSGEGAQAYGYGHYVAGNKSVAQDYATKLGGAKNPTLLYEGKPIWDQYGPIGMAGEELVYKLPEHVEEAVKAMHRAGGDVDKAKGILRSKMVDPVGASELDPWHSPTDLGWIARDKNLQNAIKSNSKDALDYLEKTPDQLKMRPGGGNLLHLEITPDEHQLLDWDKPLAEQHPELQRKLEVLGYGPEASRFNGKEIYHLLGNHLVEGTFDNYGPKASAALAKAGIPGIKYLDSGSRGKSLEDATYNYVIFDPKHIRIIGRNGESLQMSPVDHDPFATTSKK